MKPALYLLAVTLMLAILATGYYAVTLSHVYVVFTFGTPPDSASTVQMADALPVAVRNNQIKKVRK